MASDLTASATASAKVAEIFLTASAAFQKLGELTLQFNIPSSSQNSAHWTEKEVELLRGALQKFSNDLDNIAEVVKLRTGTQIRVDYKRKALDSETGRPDGKTLPTAVPVKRKALTPSVPAKRHALSSERRHPMPVMRPTPLVQQDDGYPDYMASLLSPDSP